MPVHDYECPECGARRDGVITLSIAAAEAAVVLCPRKTCERPMARRISAGAFDVTGYSAANGYARPGFQPSGFAGIKTKVGRADGKD